MIRSFKELTPEQSAQAGGKGRTLARLYQAGYRVPDGFIILPSAFNDDELTPAAWAEVQGYLARLRVANKDASFQDVAFTGGFAVRSSALSEDSAQASFAGEFETVLDARADEDIRQAIHTVRCSRHAARVQVYHQAQGLAAPAMAETGEAGDVGTVPSDAAPVPPQEIAVVVQRMVRAELAGVLFTADPLTGDRMCMTGNFVHGLGEALVSGQANAQTFTLARPRGTYSGPAELAQPARELYRAAGRLERSLGGPQDIEWAVAGGRLYILQARPITTLNGYKIATAEWNDSLTGNYLWSAANLSENAPQVLTPFSCSLRRGLVYEGIDLCDGSSMGLDGYPLAGVIGGRAYINLSVQVSAIRFFMGGDSRRALSQVTAWWGEVPADVAIPLVPVSAWQAWTKIIPATIRYGQLMARLRKQIPAFVAGNPRWVSDICRRIRQVHNPAELAALLNDEIRPYSLRAFFLTFAGTTDLPNRLEQELSKLVGVEEANALLSNLSGLSSPLESLGPLSGLSKLARGDMSREDYLEAYGHRGFNESEYAWQRPLEDPTWLDRQLAEFAKAPVDVDALLAKQQATFNAAWERFVQRYPGKVKATRVKLEKAAQAARQREAVRSEATRSSLAVRTFALRAGELTGVGEDIFFLTIEEVLALLAGDEAPRRLLPLRKETYARYQALPPYPTLIAGRFDPFQWAADPRRRSDIFDGNANGGSSAPAESEAHGKLIKGFAGALGVVEGPVRRLDRLEDSDQLQPGEVLVTTLTNIGWTPLFPRAAAIVTDLGAPLSHAAIVARELGIPAVVGCGDATMRLKTGDRVRVNGGQGTVEVL